jgi:dipeptide/tripeptide permease
MAVFGAEQIQESNITSRFFDKYLVAVNIGGIFAMSATSFTLDNDKAYRIVYIMNASVLFASALLFIIGWRYYKHVRPYDSVITNCVPVVINALQTWRRYKQNMNSINAEHRNAVQSNLANASQSSNEEEPTTIDERPSVFLDFAKIVNHGKFRDGIVDDVKSLRKAFFVFTLLIPYWLIYHQV